MRIYDLLFRSWYYFRIGYSTYLTFLLGYGSTLVTVYYLAIRNIPGLQELFPKFLGFGLAATIAAIPISVAIGWGHLKGSQVWKSELDVALEANPYSYKLPLGIPLEVLYPCYREILAGMKELLDKQGLLEPEKSKRLEELLQKFDVLLNCLLYTSPSPRDRTRSRMPSSA